MYFKKEESVLIFSMLRKKLTDLKKHNTAKYTALNIKRHEKKIEDYQNLFDKITKE